MTLNSWPRRVIGCCKGGKYKKTFRHRHKDVLYIKRESFWIVLKSFSSLFLFVAFNV